MHSCKLLFSDFLICLTAFPSFYSGWQVNDSLSFLKLQSPAWISGESGSKRIDERTVSLAEEVKLSRVQVVLQCTWTYWRSRSWKE